MKELTDHEISMINDFDKTGAHDSLVSIAKALVLNIINHYEPSSHRTSAIRRVLNAIMECNLSERESKNV